MRLPLVSSAAAATLIVFLSHGCEAFTQPLVLRPLSHHCVRMLTWKQFQVQLILLNAKKSRRVGRGGRRGRKKRAQSAADQTIILPEEDDDSDPIPAARSRQAHPVVGQPKPAGTKMQFVPLDRPGDLPSLGVCVVQVDDNDWWEDPRNANPYGARVWPASLAIARFLAQRLGSGGGDAFGSGVGSENLAKARPFVVEVGCGTGIVSLAAAGCGAHVVATDVSPVALSLTRDGWSEMSERGKGRGVATTGLCCEGGTLSTATFDLFSSDPLPIPGPDSVPSSLPPIVVAASVLYESKLAKAMARRVAEACNRGAWVILGDDDTGLREGGREKFESELERLQIEGGGHRVRRTLTETTVKQPAFGWVGKAVRILHFNAPQGITFE